MNGPVAAHGSRLAVAALALTVLALALPIQPLEMGCAETSTYALVRSLGDGTPRIDAYERETCDKALRGGHFFSSKAPGLAVTILPLYVALHATGLLPGNERTALWMLGLWSAVLPAAVMLILVRRIANRFEAGTGTLVAVTLGLATLTLPLVTLDFGHALAATLLVAAFAIALTERHAEGRPLLLLAAGALAGFAVTTEYPAALIATVIGIYSAAATRPVRRLLAFGAGGLVGVGPLLLYNQWAFGSATSLSYTSAVSSETVEGAVTVGQHNPGFYGVLTPSLSAAVRLLLADRGLLAVTPIMALGVVGLILLARRGMRAEAWAIAAIVVAMLVYNASLTISPGWVFGGDSPGPRYFYLAIPFAILPLGLVFREAPAVVVALVAVSLVRMTMATSTQPLVGGEGTGRWIARLQSGDFAGTVFSLLGLGHGWIAIAPFLLVVGLAAAAAAATAPLDPARWSIAAFIATAGAWAFVEVVGSNVTTTTGTLAATVALAALAAGCTMVVASVQRPRQPNDMGMPR